MGALLLRVLALYTARGLRATVGYRACALAPCHLRINAREIRQNFGGRGAELTGNCTVSYRLYGSLGLPCYRAPSVLW